MRIASFSVKFALLLLVGVIIAEGYGLVRADPLDVVVTVSTDKSAYGWGETVVITVSVTNVGTSTLTIVFPTTHISGFEICKAVYGHPRTLKLVYTTYDGIHQPMVTYLTLEPGETKDYTHYWGQNSETDVEIRPANYWIFGYISEPWPGIWSQPRIFEIRGHGYREH